MTNKQKEKEYFGLIKAVLEGYRSAGFEVSLTYSPEEKFKYSITHKDYNEYHEERMYFATAESALEDMGVKFEYISKEMTIMLNDQLAQLLGVENV